MRHQGHNSDGELMSSVRVQHERVGLDASHDGKTRQEFAEECDINVLMARYEATGVLTHYSQREPQYFDATDVPDLANALAIVAHAQDAFMTLPASVRREFDHDPVQFVKFAENPDNLGKMREWGLAPPEKAPDAPMRVEVVNPAAPAGGAADAPKGA